MGATAELRMRQGPPCHGVSTQGWRDLRLSQSALMQGGGLLEVSTVRLTLGEGEAPGHLGLDL